jgi:hypothetical protein
MKKAYLLPTLTQSGTVVLDTKGPPVSNLDGGFGIGASLGSVGFYL